MANARGRKQARLTLSEQESAADDLHAVLEDDVAVIFDLGPSKRTNKWENSDEPPNIVARPDIVAWGGSAVTNDEVGCGMCASLFQLADSRFQNGESISKIDIARRAYAATSGFGCRISG